MCCEYCDRKDCAGCSLNKPGTGRLTEELENEFHIHPCKYCGEQPVLFSSKRPDGHLNGYFVACDELFVCSELPETKIYPTEQEAVDAWNRGETY